MEIDAINSKVASRSTTALEQQRFGINNRPTRALDLSQEHTNGRMFEQAVQNANKAGETSASSSDNIKLSNAKIDGNKDAKNENPLTLNQKDARMAKEQVERQEAEEDGCGQSCLKVALKTFDINYLTLCELSHDTILVKGKAIDFLVGTDRADSEAETSAHISDALILGASSNISEAQMKRNKVSLLAEEAFSDIVHLELEQGNSLHTSIVQGQDEKAFGKEVVSLVFDRPALMLDTASK
jgi:hypothetical protein